MPPTAVETDAASLDQALGSKRSDPITTTRLSWVQGLTLDVQHPVDFPLPDLSDIPFQTITRDGPADLSLAFICPDGSQAMHARRTAQSLGLIEPTASVRAANRAIYYADLRTDCIPLIIHRSQTSVTAYILSNTPDERRLAALRLIRNAFIFLAREKCAAIHLHASAATQNGAAVLFCGPRMAGKTTLLISALARGYDLIGNDDCLVFADGTVAGVPTAIGIRGGTLERFAALSPLAIQPGRNIHRPREDSEADRRTLPAQDICRRMGRRMVPQATLSKILVLRPDSACSDMQITAMPPHMARSSLEAERHPTVSDHQPWWESPPSAATWPIGNCDVLCAEYAPHHLPELAQHVL